MGGISVIAVFLAAFLIYLLSEHSLRWVPLMLLFAFVMTWLMLDQEHVVHGPVAALIALVASPTTVGLLRWLELKGWLTWDGDGDAFP